MKKNTVLLILFIEGIAVFAYSQTGSSKVTTQSQGNFDDGRSGVALGLDDPGNGREAFHAIVLSDGTRALILQDSKGKLVVGFGNSSNEIFRNKDSLSFVGIKYFNKKDSLLWEQKMNKIENKQE